MSNFSEDTQCYELEEHFTQFGTVTGCKFVALTKMTVAIISFRTSEEAEKAVATSYLTSFKEQELCVEPMSKSYFV